MQGFPSLRPWKLVLPPAGCAWLPHCSASPAYGGQVAEVGVEELGLPTVVGLWPGCVLSSHWQAGATAHYLPPQAAT